MEWTFSTENLVFVGVVAGFLSIIVLAFWIHARQRLPDPWDVQSSEDVEELDRVVERFLDDPRLEAVRTVKGAILGLKRFGSAGVPSLAPVVRRTYSEVFCSAVSSLAAIGTGQGAAALVAGFRAQEGDGGIILKNASPEAANSMGLRSRARALLAEALCKVGHAPALAEIVFDSGWVFRAGSRSNSQSTAEYERIIRSMADALAKARCSDGRDVMSTVRAATKGTKALEQMRTNAGLVPIGALEPFLKWNLELLGPEDLAAIAAIKDVTNDRPPSQSDGEYVDAHTVVVVSFAGVRQIGQSEIVRRSSGEASSQAEGGFAPNQFKTPTRT